MHWTAAAQRVEIIEVTMPDGVGTARARQGAFAVLGDHHEATDAELRQGSGAAGFIPDLAVFFVEGSRVAGAVETNHVQALCSRARRAVDRMDAVPHGRMGFLKRLEFHRNVFEGKMFAFEG